MTYQVFVDDNFHFMDDSARYELGSFASFAEAVVAAKAIVDEYLVANYRPGMTAEGLFEGYKFGGEDPFIVGPPSAESAVGFSAWAYAKSRCARMCTPVEDGGDDGSGGTTP